MMKTGLAIAFAVLEICGCGNAQTNGTDFWQVAASNLRSTQAQPDIDAIRSALTPERRATIGSPIILVQIPKRDAAAALARTDRNGGVDTYMTAEGISISLRDGMIVATRGMGFDLMVSNATIPVSRAPASQSKITRSYTHLDGMNQTVTLHFVCTQTTAAVGLQIREICVSGNTSFQNTFSFSLNGQLTASSQWVSPQIGNIAVEPSP